MTDYLREYREIAKLGGNFLGLSLLNHADEIGRLVKTYGAKTLLDWGSGRGDAYRPPHLIHEAWGLNRMRIRLYDPSFPHIDTMPPEGMQFDGVICSDVLEHIPEIQIPLVLSILFGRARKFVWASVCCRKAKKKFADGTNMHLTVRPIGWWDEQFLAAQADHPGVACHLTETP